MRREVIGKKTSVPADIFAAVFDQSPHGLALFDQNDSCVRSNTRLSEWLRLAKLSRLEDLTVSGASALADLVRLARKKNDEQTLMLEAASAAVTRPCLAHALPLGNSLPGLVLLSLEAGPENTAQSTSLQEELSPWKSAIEGSDLGMWDWNLVTNQVWFSPRWKTMLGYQEQDISSDLSEWKTRVHPDDLEQALSDIQSHLEGRSPLYRNEHRMLCRDGSWKWILDRGKIISRTPDGKPSRMIGTHADITQRKQAELGLQRVRELFSQGPVVNIVWSPETGWPVRFVSSNLPQVLGYQVEEWYRPGFLYGDLIHPDDLALIQQEVSAHISQGQNMYEQAYRLRRKDGSWCYLYDYTRLERDPEGEIIEIRGYIIDQTERIQAERALRQSESYLANIIEDQAGSIWTIDSNYCFVMFNSFFAADYFQTYQVRLRPGLNALDILSPDLKSFWEPRYRSALQGERQSFTFSEKVTGRSRLYRVMLNPIYLHQEIIGASAFSIDITETMEREESLRKSQQQLSLFASHFNGVAFILDQEGIFQLSEGLGLKDLGLQPGQALGLSAFDMYKDYPQILQELRQGLAGESFNSVLDMGNIIFNIHYQPLLDQDGQVSGLLGLAHNITEQIQAEENLRRSQEELHQAEKLQAIGQLAGGIAHDFNNQLTGIVGYADLLRQSLSGQPELKEFSEHILLAARRAADITTQLLAFARKGKYLSRVMDVHGIIIEVIGILQHTIDRRINLKRTFSAENPFIMGDPSQIQNALMNLALNSRDAMPEGGELEFTTTNISLQEEREDLPLELSPGEYLCVSVSDNGTGMEESVRQKIFEPFFTTKEPGKGTGMGMPAVYGTVKNHNGAVTVSSRPGQGTVVCLYFPAQKADAAAAAGDMFRVPGKMRSLHILLVDDEHLVLESANRILKGLGHTVVCCQNGAEAVGYYKAHWENLDLVILDMVMPVMDGRTAFLEMQRINPAVKVLLSSGYSLEEKTQELLNQGVSDFLQKPYRIDQLISRISRVCPDPKN